MELKCIKLLVISTLKQQVARGILTKPATCWRELFEKVFATPDLEAFLKQSVK